MSEEHAAVDEFATGFSGEDVAVSAETQPDPAAEDLVGEASPEPEAPAAEAEAPAVVDEPKFRQITEDEYASLMANAAAVDTMREEFSRKIDTAFGKIGGTEQVLRNIQAATPKGKIPTVTKEDLGPIAANYEYLGDDLVDAFNRVLGKLEGTGPATAEVDTTKVASLVQEGIDKALPELANEIETRAERRLEFKLVKQKHGDVEKIFADPDFRKWFADTKQQDSWEADKVIPILDAYKKAKTPPPAPSNRQAVLKAAINPASAAGTPRGRVEEDEFMAGYKARDS